MSDRPFTMHGIQASMILQEKVNERDVPAVLDDLQSGPGKSAAGRRPRAVLCMRWSDSGRPCLRTIVHGGAVLRRRHCTFAVADGIDSFNAGPGVPGSTEAAQSAHTAASSCASAVATDPSNTMAADHDGRS